MVVADNTRLKTMEADIKKLYQLLEDNAEANRAEIARLMEANQSTLNTIHQALDQVILGQQGNSQNEFQNRPPLPPRRMNFDLPRFDGSDALGWIFSVDQYFEFYHIPEDEQIGIAGMHMSGLAIPWFQMTQRSLPFRSWTQLKRAIEIEFGPSLFKSPRESLFKIQQRGTVAAYYAEFIALANRTTIEPPEALRDCFISGLRMEIKRKDQLMQQLEQQVMDHHLSLNAMKGTSGLGTIRLKAFVQGLEVQVLIGGGSSDSFIQPRIAKFLKLPIEPEPGFRVMVGNFDIMQVEGYVPALEVSMQGHNLQIPKVYVLQVAGGDLVIGATWLRTLKAHIADYDALLIRFLHDGKFITIKGDETLSPQPAQFNHIKRLFHTDVVAEAFTGRDSPRQQHHLVDSQGVP
ncbi:Retrotransposon gag domain [Sesbania bispinosa]|nr:Retrotransposon gag domain [Sesbania bispinosa]